jgi:Flp pilus assembly pilin Flp
MLARLLFRDELGAGIIEYALVGGMIAVTCLFGIRVLGANARTQLTASGTAISAASTSSAH